MTKKTVIVIRETATQSLISDAGTGAMIVALVGVGWLIGSHTLEWIGGMMAIFFLFTKGTNKRLTVSEARDVLDQIERDQNNQNLPVPTGDTKFL